MATLGLFLGLDVLVAYVVEPIVIGAKTGVSSMAMLVSAIFWSWLWGPVGLVLSTPLTVCLAVLGKHVPRLSSLAVLLDDQPALEDQLVLYHRLLSGDEEEAQEILDKRFREKTRAAGLRRDRHPRAAPRRSRSRPRRDQRSPTTSTSCGPFAPWRTPRPMRRATPEATAPLSTGETGRVQRIVGVSARTVTDETIWEMLAQLFDPEKVQLESVGSSYLGSDLTSGQPRGVFSGPAGSRLCHLGPSGRPGPGSLHLPAPAREAAQHACGGHSSRRAGQRARELPATHRGRSAAGLLHARERAHDHRARHFGAS